MDIIVNGARGRMGQEVCRLLQEDGHRLAAAVDRSGQDGCYARLADYTGPADVVIDFSNHEGVEELMAYCVQRGLPLVAATTGYTPEEFQRIQEGAQTIPVFQSYNMSIGVALLARLVGQAAAIFGGCDVEIVEAHHNRKADAPSGTALMIADAAASALEYKAEYNFGRHERRMARPKNEIGISAVRGGTIVGDHTIIFAGHDEVIEIKHSAQSREIFANGAVKAAKFLADVQEAGMYDMSQLVNE